ncbi:hypothetical protein FHETE_8188 [Fusarium heterosporum]|uniref:Uncharacterized protein n=1 Tax=Fusarium heterosporum TaxID=42747 RepID=A0A8H5WKX5_FUSHE|nr:hypothetical protein FHETE_8188 [Fusarium heterosporum]
MGSQKKGRGQIKPGNAKCPLPGCSKDRGNYTSSNEPAMFCKDHTCHAGSKCKSMTDKKHKFCYTHSKCAAFGCTAQVRDFEGDSFQYSKFGSYEWLCPHHSCQMKGKDGQCYQIRRDFKTQYCAEHSKKAKCSFPDCFWDRTSASNVCEHHTCLEPNCHRQTYLGADVRECYRHQPCTAPGCTTHVGVDNNKRPNKFCINHALCKNPGGCDTVIHPDYKYCEKHRCAQPTCTHLRDFQSVPYSEWCGKHRCSVPGCIERALNLHDRRFQNCSRHTCQQRDCSETANEAVFGSFFCPAHTCINGGCRQEAKVPGEYCREEACTKEGCGKVRATRSHLCIYHRDEDARPYVLSEPSYLGMSRPMSRADSFGHRRRSSGYIPAEYDMYYSHSEDSRRPVIRPQMSRRYDLMDDEFHRRILRQTPRR